MVERVTSLVNKFGTQTILDRANEVLSEEMKETVFTTSADVALADGVVELAEKDRLNQAQEALGISDDLVKRMVDAMLIRNCG